MDKLGCAYACIYMGIIIYCSSFLCGFNNNLFRKMFYFFILHIVVNTRTCDTDLCIAIGNIILFIIPKKRYMEIK